MARADRSPMGAGTEDDPVYPASPEEFRAWLEREQHRTEAWVGFHKVATGVPSITWPQLVDVVLCFGWIDGIRKGVDAGRYRMRVTPRKPGSIWSNRNIARMHELAAAGLVTPAGLAAFEARRDDRSGVYSFEQDEEWVLPPEFEVELRADQAAADFFDAQPPGYRRTAVHWVLSAKREETRLKRLRQLVQDSAGGLRIALVRRPPRT